MIDQLWPGRYHSKTLSEVTTRRAAKELGLTAGSAIEIDWQNFLKLSLTDLEESLRMERARREIIQRRALVFLGYAAIVTALTLGTLNLIESDSSALSLAFGFGLILTVTFLGGSVLCAFIIIRPALVPDMYLQAKMNDGEPASEDERKPRNVDCDSTGSDRQPHPLYLCRAQRPLFSQWVVVPVRDSLCARICEDVQPAVEIRRRFG